MFMMQRVGLSMPGFHLAVEMESSWMSSAHRWLSDQLLALPHCSCAWSGMLKGHLAASRR